MASVTKNTHMCTHLYTHACMRAHTHAHHNTHTHTHATDTRLHLRGAQGALAPLTNSCPPLNFKQKFKLKSQIQHQQL